MSEVMQGYKQTEVGVIPEGWEVRKLGKIAEIVTGNTPPTNDDTNYGEKYLFVGPGDLGNWKWVIDTAKKLSHKGFNISRRVPVNSILFTCIGSTIGKAGMASRELATNQQINAIFPSGNFSIDYLFYSLNILAPKIKARASEQAVPIINKTEFGETLIPLPPTLAEQIAIATVLSDTDALIQKLDQLIAKKRNIKQGAMQELLTGKRRLLGFRGECRYKQTEVGEIPEDWECKCFGEVFTGFSSGQTPSRAKPEYYRGDIPWITSGELNYNVIYDTNENITHDAVKKTNLKIISRGVFLFAITGLEAEGTRGSCGVTGIEAATNQSCMALYPQNKVAMDYLFYYYVLNGKKLALEYCQGTKQQSYTASTAKLLPIKFPPTLAEQIAIAAVLSDMDAEIAVLERKRDKYKAVKQGMMQVLLTGKIRLVGRT